MPLFVAVPGDAVLLRTSRCDYAAIVDAASTTIIDGKTTVRYRIRVGGESVDVTDADIVPIANAGLSIDAYFIDEILEESKNGQLQGLSELELLLRAAALRQSLADGWLGTKELFPFMVKLQLAMASIGPLTPSLSGGVLNRSTHAV